MNTINIVTFSDDEMARINVSAQLSASLMF